MKFIHYTLSLLLLSSGSYAYDGDENYEEGATIETSQEEAYPSQLPAAQPTIDSENYAPPAIIEDSDSARPAEGDEGYYDDY